MVSGGRGVVLLGRGGIFSFGVVGFQAFLHDAECGFALVDHDEAATVFCGGLACGAASGEEIHYGFAWVGVDADYTLEDSERLLRGIAGFFFAGG